LNAKPQVREENLLSIAGLLAEAAVAATTIGEARGAALANPLTALAPLSSVRWRAT
jgi:hypothetical protein